MIYFVKSKYLVKIVVLVNVQVFMGLSFSREKREPVIGNRLWE